VAPTAAAPEVSGTPQPVLSGGGAARPGAETAGAGEGDLSAVVERLRPAVREEILWAPMDPALTAPSLEQRLQLELAVRLLEQGDSVAAEEAIAAAATDWTFTDAGGKRWGVSPGQIHLGGITIPIPFAFGTTPGNRDEVNRRTWEWSEIQRQSSSGAVRASWRERAEAIRQRRDRERAEAAADSAGLAPG
jgi:hypothetical protein